MDKYEKIRMLKYNDFIYEEDLIKILNEDFGLSINDSVYMLSKIYYINEEYNDEHLNLIIKDIDYRNELMTSLISLRHCSFVNKTIDSLMEDSVIASVEAYLKNTNGIIEFTIQAQCIAFTLHRLLPMYFKDCNSNDETVIKRTIISGAKNIKGEYPRISKKLIDIYSSSEWNNNRAMISFMTHEDSINNRFLKNIAK